MENFEEEYEEFDEDIDENYSENSDEKEVATDQVIKILEEFGKDSKFLWFRELHKISDIDKGLLRNILNELKKSREVKEMKASNNRIYFCLSKYYRKCKDVEYRFKGIETTLKDGSRQKFIQGATKNTERTRKRLQKQMNKRRAKAFTKAKNKRPHKS
jgi:predicted transcriptional regulator